MLLTKHPKAGDEYGNSNRVRKYQGKPFSNRAMPVIYFDCRDSADSVCGLVSF